jgi:hypothetical protein
MRLFLFTEGHSQYTRLGFDVRFFDMSFEQLRWYKGVDTLPNGISQMIDFRVG